jgi:glycosyltransferase involved in cell wall biosynthesis
MKILQFCYKPPFPALDGGSMGMHYVTEGLINNGHEVKVLSFHSKKHPCRVDKLPVEYVEKTKFETVFVDLDIKPIPALVAYLCGESYHVKRFINEQMKRKLVEILKAEDFDIIQVESIFLTPYLPIMRRFSNAKIVLRAPNIEHKIWERIYKATKTPFKRGYIKHLALTLKYYELNHINDYDAVSPVTEVDAEYFRENGLRKKCKGIPFGMNPPELLSDVLEEKNTIFHIGSMNWHPNEQGIKWFLEECWDKIRQTTPNVQAYFAGRYMPNWLKNTSIEGVHIVGEVEDSIRFMTSKQIMVVPLLSGSGIRIKIIEAMSIGKTVIATTIAAEGIMY